MRYVYVGQQKCLVLEHPEYAVAHPVEAKYENAGPDYECNLCLLAVRPDTGDIILLWGCGYLEPINWGISREDPNYARHCEELGLNCNN